MKAGTKRTLAECLGMDDSYSEIVDDDRWTGNSAAIARVSAALDTINVELRKHQEKISAIDERISKYRERTSDTHERISDLHDMINQFGQQKIMESAVGCSHIRNRFISTFRRDILDDATSKDWEIIGQGNLAAHDGNFWADAKLYGREDIVAEDGKQCPPRDDYHVFKQLYGVAPSFAAIIDYTPTILVLEKHATIVSSAHLQTTDNFKERFNAFVSSLRDSHYASGYLVPDSPHLKGLLSAYRAFWDAVRTEVSRRETTDL
ncbi:hypothetical protein BDV33DRAFT_208626 [Aspergillus novoparasiticus]|uniref:Uncharacterized protein n=1 Tax=Aspergillus novoparasiticus TaxID=986946 RepID=A0A5N6EE94_9EURO|nr:hypothetical protein BDV33DRAFT_208626 [Aspergillus novoparasiticus]